MNVRLKILIMTKAIGGAECLFFPGLLSHYKHGRKGTGARNAIGGCMKTTFLDLWAEKLRTFGYNARKLCYIVRACILI
jgi:hypothetical protein